MARGWESKDIEAQQDLRQQMSEARGTATAVAMSKEQGYKRESLLLTRTRVLHDLEKATHPRHRHQLELALAHVEAQISELA
ncbi:MAG: hypothetical protein IT168_25185 [Bryobacterales bacterium]|nr:hypothetical protein [Bryobacterales bacterium]